ETSVVLEQKILGQFAIHREGLQTIDMSDANFRSGAAVIIVASLDAASAEKTRIIAIVIFVAGRVHKQPIYLIVLHEPVVSAEHETVLGVVNLVISDPVVSDGRVIARGPVGVRLPNSPRDGGHHVVNVIVENLAAAPAQLHRHSRLIGRDLKTFHANETGL